MDKVKTIRIVYRDKKGKKWIYYSDVTSLEVDKMYFNSKGHKIVRVSLVD
jgi:hypothetical protein